MTSIAVVTARAELVERCQRWAAAVQAPIEHVQESPAVRRAWRRSLAVIVDASDLPSLRRLDLPRRDHVLVVAAGHGVDVWPDALALGAVGVWEQIEDDAVTGALTHALDGRGEACVLAVVGATGGAGASTLVVACAEAAQRRGAEALAIDADADGPGLELIAGIEHAPGLRWHEITMTDGHVAARSLVEALPTSATGAHVLSFSRADRAALHPSPVLTAAQRGFDLVVGDVPRHAVADGLGADLVSRSVASVLLVPEHVTGLAAAERVLGSLGVSSDRVAVISRAVPGGLGPREVQQALGLPVLARLPQHRALAQDIQHGRGPGRSRRLRAVAGKVLVAVGIEAA